MIAMIGITTTTMKIPLTTMTEIIEIPEMIKTKGIAIKTKKAIIPTINDKIDIITFSFLRSIFEQDNFTICKEYFEQHISAIVSI